MTSRDCTSTPCRRSHCPAASAFSICRLCQNSTLCSSARPARTDAIASTRRGNRHEDLVNTVSAVIALLATPLSGAEGWLEFYRRLAEEPNRLNTDYDDIQAPNYGWSFDQEIR
ncbi:MULTISPECIES: hypothetical protein [unclassified Bradyrhizobium]|uniref:hypothetical protein n=1 Tax=unclassified Bradyrhizobium TaxID=2631580 RepID=UPI00223FEBEB|nr:MULTISPECIES: hypothetical protein [unclassified Bradyrhizobium]